MFVAVVFVVCVFASSSATKAAIQRLFGCVKASESPERGQVLRRGNRLCLSQASADSASRVAALQPAAFYFPFYGVNSLPIEALRPHQRFQFQTGALEGIASHWFKRRHG